MIYIYIYIERCYFSLMHGHNDLLLFRVLDNRHIDFDQKLLESHTVQNNYRSSDKEDVTLIRDYVLEFFISRILR